MPQILIKQPLDVYELSCKLHLKPNASLNTYISAIHHDAGKPEIGSSVVTWGNKVKVSS